jgi:hypothetical protein
MLLLLPLGGGGMKHCLRDDDGTILFLYVPVPVPVPVPPPLAIGICELLLSLLALLLLLLSFLRFSPLKAAFVCKGVLKPCGEDIEQDDADANADDDNNVDGLMDLVGVVVMTLVGKCECKCKCKCWSLIIGAIGELGVWFNRAAIPATPPAGGDFNIDDIGLKHESKLIG